jgi:hypothetical protein
MRKVIVSTLVQSKMSELNLYLTQEFLLSWAAAEVRIKRMEDFVASLSYEADYALCRFEQWRALGYRCAVFKKSWVFAYEIVSEGVIVRDMSHTAALAE